MKFTKFFVLLIICSIVIAMLLSRDTGEEHVVVYREMDKVTLQMPVEEYMLGVMAAVANPEYEPECLKALAVLIRGELMAKADENIIMVSGNDIYYEYAKRESLYGENREAFETKLTDAISETGGMIAVSDNTVAAYHYHALSAGMTRCFEGSEGVACIKSMEADSFITQVYISKSVCGEIGEITKDNAGYVKEIEVNGRKVSGEYFRNAHELPSANFDIQEQGEDYLITTRGQGHGLGMDIYYANELAKQGYTYDQILNYFFRGFSLKKIIV